MARRVKAACARYGILTKYFRRTTDGAGSCSRSEWKITPFEMTTSALCLSTRTTALLAVTTARGRSETLRTRALPMGGDLREYSNVPESAPRTLLANTE